MTTATETLMKFEVFRYQPDWDEPTFQVYDVPYRDGVSAALISTTAPTFTTPS